MEPNAKIEARRRGLKACTDALSKLEKTAKTRADRMLERYGADSDQYNAALAEYMEIKGTVYNWRYMVRGRERDLELACRSEGE